MGEKNCIALVSGGIDSPVAVARMLRLGWKIKPIHCSQDPITGPEPELKTIRCIQALRKVDGKIGEIARENIDDEMIVVPVAETLSKFTEKWCHSEYFIHMKRLFNAIADIASESYESTHLLTGENLGQVSSQTLGNLGAVEEVTSLIPLRPLLGLDKTVITHMARKLGTFEISSGPEVCDALGPSMPTTVANKEWLEKSEERLGGLRNLAIEAWAKRRIVSL